MFAKDGIARRTAPVAREWDMPRGNDLFLTFAKT